MFQINDFKTHHPGHKMKEIVLATHNKGKLVELQTILAPVIGISQASLGILDSVEETGLSFIENALLKARYASRMSNKPALADDSGLVVPWLNGEPGIYSARYAGKGASDAENVDLLLKKLETAPDGERQAWFYCAIALVRHADDPVPVITTGQWTGFIAKHPSGKDGFGYDPVFYVAEYQCTAAQLPAHIKNKISHRAKALIQLQENLKCSGRTR